MGHPQVDPWEYYNEIRHRPAGELRLNDLIAIMRGGGMDRASDSNAVGVPGELGLNNPNEVMGNWGNQAIIKYNPSQADINGNILPQQQLISIEGSGRRPCALTIDTSISSEQAQGTATYPSGKDGTGALLAYRMRFLISYGVSYGQTGFRTDVITIDPEQRVTVPANILYVSAIMLAPPAGYVSGSMSVGAIVGTHGTPSLSPVTSTSYVDGLAANASSAPIPLPEKAGFLLPVQTSDVNGVFQLDFQNQSGNPVTSLLVGAGQLVAAIPCGSSDYYQVVITNKGLITASYRLPFQLSL